MTIKDRNKLIHELRELANVVENRISHLTRLHNEKNWEADIFQLQLDWLKRDLTAIQRRLNTKLVEDEV
jgi:hypothetical protein